MVGDRGLSFAIFSGARGMALGLLLRLSSTSRS
jgi:hypothetical protein